MTKNDIFVSVVFVVENQSFQLIEYLAKVTPFLMDRYNDYEIVIIDQHSTDGTEQQMNEALAQFQSVRYIRLAQPVPADVALAAGIENAIGDFVINLNIGFDACDLIVDFVELGQKGNDIVIGTSERVSSVTYRVIRQMSRRLLYSIGYTLPSNSTGSFCLSRRAVNAVTESGRFYCKLHMRMANVGYPLQSLSYSEQDTNIPHKTILGGVRETVHHMVFNSTKPLRWMSMLGVVGSVIAMIFSLYTLLVNLINDHVATGWTTTILFMSCLFAILFTMLSFFGEYLARLLDDRSEHKEYNVVYEKNSSVMLNEKRNNVQFNSLSCHVNSSQTGRNK